MENTQSHNKLTILSIAVSLVALILVWNPFNLGVSDNADIQGIADQNLSANQTIKSLDELVIVDQSGDEKTFILEHIENESAYEFIIRATNEYDELDTKFEEYNFDGLTSYFLTSINGYEPDTLTEYWEFVINGEPSFTGLDDYAMQPSDEVTFRLAKL